MGKVTLPIQVQRMRVGTASTQDEPKAVGQGQSSTVSWRTLDKPLSNATSVSPLSAMPGSGHTVSKLPPAISALLGHLPLTWPSTGQEATEIQDDL